MFRPAFCSVRAALAAALALIALAGCAADQRSQQTLDWIVWQEAEKKRLDDSGFPQYIGGD